jgi:hypothetical protein
VKSERPIFIRPPQGYEKYDSDGILLIWELLKALYGLKQANYLWYHTIVSYLARFGFMPLPSDQCVER